MLICRKVENNIYEIIIPDEGVHQAKEEINLDDAMANIDNYTLGLYDYLSRLTRYYREMILEINNSLINNSSSLKYELLEMYEDKQDNNLLIVFKVKCNIKTVNKLIDKIKKLINDRKEYYENERCL